jgi:hypothetical protein
MADITSYLPAWLTAAAAPAGLVMAFFWKGDEAIGPDMKDWLSKKIAGQHSAQAQVFAIDPLGRVFDAAFGRKPNGLPSFLRVALISTLAFFAAAFAIAIAFHFRSIPWRSGDIAKTIELILINALFDYVSVTKALFIMRRIGRGSGATVSFLLLDFFGTVLILLMYYTVVENLLERSNFGISEMFVGPAFFATTFLTFFLTLLYVVAIRVLVSGSKLRSWISWALPVKTLPVRSIGIMAGSLLFLALLFVGAI